MNLLIFSALLAAILLFLSLPYFLLAWLALPLSSIPFLFGLSASLGLALFYMLYIRPTRNFTQKTLGFNLEIMNLKNEKINLQQQIDILENLISRDSLTGLWNKSFCLDRLQEEHRRSQRSKKAFSILMLDIDHFKNINDNLGHLVGDDYLMALAELLQKNTRLSDVVCRYGGDEFLVILPDTPCQGALAVAEKIIHMAHSVSVNPHFPLSFSIGVCGNCESYEDIETIINKADMALYQAKREGRKRVSMACE